MKLLYNLRFSVLTELLILYIVETSSAMGKVLVQLGRSGLHKA